MKTKIIPFDLETAKKIQVGEIEGKIKTRDGEREMRIVCYESTARFCGDIQPIIAQNIEDCEEFFAYYKNGNYVNGADHVKDLVLEVPDNEPQFKPFDKVLVRDGDDFRWYLALYALYCDDIKLHEMVGGSRWNQCILYEGNEKLLGTTDKPKEN